MDELMFPPYYEYHAAEKTFVDFFRRRGRFMIGFGIYRSRSAWYCVNFFCWPFETWEVSFRWRIHPA
jgi:hypothetical protein